MYTVTDMNGRTHYIGEAALDSVEDAGPNGSGIRSYVHFNQGRMVESPMTANEVIASRVQITAQTAAPPPAADAVVTEAMTDAALNAWWGGDYWRDDEDSVVAGSRRGMRAAIAAALAARDTK